MGLFSKKAEHDDGKEPGGADRPSRRANLARIRDRRNTGNFGPDERPDPERSK